jgi:hypothetical protein
VHQRDGPWYTDVVGVQILRRVAVAIIVIGAGLGILGNYEHGRALTDAETQSLTTALSIGTTVEPNTGSADTWHTVMIGGWIAVGAGVVLLACTFGLDRPDEDES